MSIKASEVGDRLRQIAGKRDHRKVVPDDDYLVLRPGPNFDWLMGNVAAGQSPPLVPEPNLAGEDCVKLTTVPSKALRDGTRVAFERVWADHGWA